MGDNKQITTMESMFALSIDLRDKGELEHAIRVLSKILDNYSQDKRIDKVYSVLGGICNDLGHHENAMTNFKKATEHNPDSELASLGLYVSLASLDKDVDAIEEMKRFLKSHPAKLYKDTLDELLDGLKKGFMTNYRDDITTLAKNNGFKV